jgi:hypothetical protein
MSELSPLPESAQPPAPLEAADADPYNGVALGVECAWPMAHSLSA